MAQPDIHTKGVYMTKRADAAKLLRGQYFNVNTESGSTRVFKLRHGPMQCFRCLSLGHKACSCTKAQVCSRCAQPGHRHIATMSVKQRPQGVPYATGPTNRPAASIGLSTQRVMFKQMQILQLNMQERREVQHSVMDDASLKEYTALAVSEPYVFEMDGKVSMSPMGH